MSFRVGDALKLPFSENEFDVAVSQAMLVLIDDKKKAIQQALRVTKPGGYCGWVELSWKEEPPKEFLDQVSTVICAYCMVNVHTFEGWENLFEDAGLKELETLDWYPADTVDLRPDHESYRFKLAYHIATTT